jgi:hypothetical protein
MNCTESREIIGVEQAIAFVEKTIAPDYLNQMERKLLRDSWNGLTYAQMSRRYQYGDEYMKNVGFHLWRRISNRLGETITKSSFQSVIRRNLSSLVFDTKPQLQLVSNLTNEEFPEIEKVSDREVQLLERIQSLEARLHWLETMMLSTVAISA